MDSERLNAIWTARPKSLGSKTRNKNLHNIYERARTGVYDVDTNVKKRTTETLKKLQRNLNTSLAGKGSNSVRRRLDWVEGFLGTIDPKIEITRPATTTAERAARGEAVPGYAGSTALSTIIENNSNTENSNTENSNTENSNTENSLNLRVDPLDKRATPPSPFIDRESAPVATEPISISTQVAPTKKTIRELRAERAAGQDKKAAEGLGVVSGAVEAVEVAQEVSGAPEAPEAPETHPCSQFFDPCSREPIEDIETLERRVREIKKLVSQSIEEIRPLSKDINTRLDLLLYILNQPKPPTEKLLEYRGNQTGQIYEALWDIAFAVGHLYERNDSFFLVNGKAENITSLEGNIFIKNPIEYLSVRSVNMGASGASDITFGYKSRTTAVLSDPCEKDVSPEDAVKPCFYFCSSKYYKKDATKGVEKFDIQKIYTAAKNLHAEYDIKIILLVKNRSVVESKLKRAISRYIAEEASAVYGIEDLIAVLTRIYDQVKARSNGNPITAESLAAIYGITKKAMPVLVPRLHQDMAIFSVGDAIKRFTRGQEGNTNKFLVGIVPRGGKTYIAGGLVTYLQPKRVVVLLGAKSETITQFRDELFKHYQDFNDYTVIDVLEGGVDYDIDMGKKYIFIMSVELYKMESSKRKLLVELKSGTKQADLFICDEAHLKQTTARAVKALEDGTEKASSDAEEAAQLSELDTQISKSVPVVYMTGTYIKPLTAFKIPAEQTFIWEYQDIQAGKHIIENEEYFKKNFGDIYEKAIAKALRYGETYESIQAMYRKFPELILLSTHFTDNAKGEFLLQPAGRGYPTLTHLFQVKKDFNPTENAPDIWHTGFTNSKGVARLINYLSPGHEITEEDGEAIQPISSVMRRIDKISQRMGDRLSFFTSEFVPHSQLWFLPSMQGHPLIKRMAALAGTVFQSEWYRRHFTVLAVSSSQDWSSIPGAKDNRITIQGGEFAWACPSRGKSLKDCILEEERKARQSGKGLVILAQNMLHLGISLACVDIVVLMDDGEKVDERIQKMYRALTESVNKKAGYIVDLNYFRSVVAIMNYKIQTTEIRDKKRVHIHNVADEFNKVLNIFRIDDDMPIYEGSEEGRAEIQTATIPELESLVTRAGRGDGLVLGEAGAAMNRNIESILAEDYDSSLDTMLGDLQDELERKKVLREAGDNVARAQENDEEGKEGEVERPPVAREPPRLFPEEVMTNPDAKRRAFMDIFKTTMKLGVFGTDKASLEDYIRELRENDELFDTVFNTLVERAAINDSAEKEFVRGLLIHELQKIVDKGKGDSYRGMKESFNTKGAREEKFQEVLNYIVDHLTPKDKERHKFGEVFTPLTLVDEMLSKLPEDVWTQKDWKWLDPANGIGNFPIKAFVGQKEGEHKYPGLFEGLRKAIPDDKARCKHIVENMLYMVDINGKNNMIARRLFEKLCPGAKANIEQIDKKEGFLADEPLKFNGKEVKEFDVIMGNPPFNRGAVRVAMVTTKTRKERKELGVEGDAESGYWAKFVEKALKGGSLRSNGYLLFIHPITWFKKDRAGVHDIILQSQILNIRTYFKSQAKTLFGGRGEISVAYYLLENKKPYKETKIINTKGKLEKIRLSNKSILVLEGNSIYNKVLQKCSTFQDNKDLQHKTHKSCDNTGTHKLVTILEDTGNIKYVMSKTPHPDQNVPKLIIGGIPKPIVLYDKTGEYGLYAKGQRHYFIGDNLDKINNYFKTKLSTYLLRHIKYEQGFIKPVYYPDIRTLELDTINDKTLADFFEFTAEERKEIEEMPEPIHPKAANIIKINCSEIKDEKEPKEGGGPSRRPSKTRKLRR